MTIVMTMSEIIVMVELTFPLRFGDWKTLRALFRVRRCERRLRRFAQKPLRHHVHSVCRVGGRAQSRRRSQRVAILLWRVSGADESLNWGH